MRFYRAESKNIPHGLLISIFIKNHDNGQDLETFLEMKSNSGLIRSRQFLNIVELELSRFFHIFNLSREILETTYNVKFCFVKWSGKKDRPGITFESTPLWGANVVFVRKEPRSGKIHYLQISKSEFLDQVKLQGGVRGANYKSVVKVESSFQMMNLFDWGHPNLNFSLGNLLEFQKITKVSIIIYQKTTEGLEPYYKNVEKKYPKEIVIEIEKEPETLTETLVNFDIILRYERLPTKYKCNISKNCNYTTCKVSNYHKPGFNIMV